MALLKKEDIIAQDAIDAPNELAANLKKVAKELAAIMKMGKSADPALETTKSLKGLNDQTEKLTLRQKELDKINKQIEVSQARSNKDYAKKQKQLKDIRDETKKLIDEETKLVGTEEKILDLNKKLRSERKKLDLATEEGAKRLKEINTELDKNTESLKELNDQYVQQKMNVGNYENSLAGLFSTLKEASQSEGGIKNLFATFVSGAKAATKAGLKFLMTPIGAAIGAIVAAFAIFNNALSSNFDLANKFGAVWEGIKGVFSELMKRVGLLSGALVELFSLNFDKAAEKASKAFDDLGDSLGDAYDQGVLFFNLMRDNRKINDDSIVAIANLEKALAILEQRMGDSTISLEEQKIAAEQAGKAQIKLGEELLKVAESNEAVAKATLDSLKVENEERRNANTAYKEAQAERIRLETELFVTQKQIMTERKQILQDIFELELDYLIDNFDNVKTTNERIIHLEGQTLKRKGELYQETESLFQKTLKQQRDLFEDYVGEKIDFDAILEESDQKAAVARVMAYGVSEKVALRMLEQIREQRTMMLDLRELEIEIYGNPIALKAKTEETEGIKDNLDKRLEDMVSHNKSIQDAEAKHNAIMSKFAEEEKQRRQEIAAMGIDLFHQRSDARAETLASENEAIQANLDAQIEAASKANENGEVNQERIDELNKRKADSEERTQRKIAAIKKRQAILDKVIAIGQIAIETAKGVAAATAASIATAGGSLLFIPSIIATGAIQAAIVAAQPIPQFALGTNNSPEGLAIVNERGVEILESPDGSMKMINSNKPTLTYLEKGTKVHTAKESARMLGSNIMSSLAFQQINERTNDQTIINQLEGIKKTIKNKKEVHMNFDKHAVEFWTKKGELWSKIRNQDYA